MRKRTAPMALPSLYRRAIAGAALLVALESGARSNVEDGIGQLLGRCFQIAEVKIDLRKPLRARPNILTDLAAIVLGGDYQNQVPQLAVDE